MNALQVEGTLFMEYDDIAWDIVRYEFMSHLFLHTRYSQVCLLTVSLTNGLDYRCNLELLLLVEHSFRQKLALIAFRQGWRVSSLRFERAECCVALECLGRLLDMHEVLGSDLGTETRYLVRLFVVFFTILRQIPGWFHTFSHVMATFFHVCTVHSS